MREEEEWRSDVATEEIAVGDRLLLRPGERFPVDGVVLAGEGGADESVLTGESRAVYEEPGRTIFAGSLNLDGAFVIEAREVGRERLLSKIASPLAVWIGAGQARPARYRHSGRGGAFERLASARHLFIDKTGTLTEGRPVVSAIEVRLHRA